MLSDLGFGYLTGATFITVLKHRCLMLPQETFHFLELFLNFCRQGSLYNLLDKRLNIKHTLGVAQRIIYHPLHLTQRSLCLEYDRI